MSMHRLLIRLAAVVLAAVTLAAAPAGAQEISKEHLQLALKAIAAAKVGQGFDNVLPLMTERVQDRIIRARPDMHQEITATVEEVALSLAGRRNELNDEIAAIWARSFTEEELTQIIEFYSSPVGQKFVETGPKVISSTLQVVKGWSDRLADELFEKSREALKAKGIEF
jgi:hypothetical protein